jgi:hypothetical protein
VTVPDRVCTWGVSWADVELYCATAPTLTDAQGEAAVAAAEEAIRSATGNRFGVCELTARSCARSCGGTCGSPCCSTTYYDRLDLDPTGRQPVQEVLSVTESSTGLIIDEYALQDQRWLLRLPSGERWPHRSDVGDPVPDLEVVWTAGRPPPQDLILNGVIPLACDLGKKIAGVECSIPDNVLTVSREGASFVMNDVTNLVQDGLLGPASVIAAIRRAHPYGAAVSSPGGLLDPAAVTRPTTVQVASGGVLAPVGDEFDRTRGDAWLWGWDTTEDISDWSDLIVVIRDGPTEAANILAGSPAQISTTGTDFAEGHLEWLILSAVTEDIPAGVQWIEVSADVPSEGGPFTIMPARRLRVREQIA